MVRSDSIKKANHLFRGTSILSLPIDVIRSSIPYLTKGWTRLFGNNVNSFTEMSDDDETLHPPHITRNSPENLQVTRSFMSYLYAGEFGFEIAQSNAAYLLSRKGNMMIFSDNSNESGLHLFWLEIRQLKKSVKLGSIDSLVQLGDLYIRLGKFLLKNMKDEFSSQIAYKHAVLCYSKASSKGHPLGSYYSGNYKYSIIFNIIYIINHNRLYVF